jgi:hypothetical protein
MNDTSVMTRLEEIRNEQEKQRFLANQLLTNIKSNLNIVEPLVASFRKSEPEFIYRFYHQSFKVFGYKELVRFSVNFFEKISPSSRPLNTWYRSIIDKGLANEFNVETTNQNWLQEVQPLLEAFWHSKYFTEQMLSSATTLETAPQTLPYDWAAVLYLFDLR